MTTKAPGAAGLIARGAELHQQFLARQLHGGELLEPGPQPLQLAPADRPLLGYAIAALCQNVELAFLRQELDLHTGSRLLPPLSDEMLLQARQAALRRAHQVMHGRVSSAHVGEHLLGRHAAIHQPDGASEDNPPDRHELHAVGACLLWSGRSGSAMTGHSAAPPRRRRSTSTASTAAVNTSGGGGWRFGLPDAAGPVRRRLRAGGNWIRI